jgi:hypothetical protein
LAGAASRSPFARHEDSAIRPKGHTMTPWAASNPPSPPLRTSERTRWLQAGTMQNTTEATEGNKAGCRSAGVRDE